MAQSAPGNQLKKNLTLFDVYAISTGAMFSSGFFLLPGIATAEGGPAAVLAYLLAGVLVLPAMFSKAELTTAMPKAGGTYYFLDRSLGPLAGTVGGLGTWLALVFKSAFALIGMGAYLAIFFDVPIKPLAAALTVAFAAINIVGAKETSGLQRMLVTVLIAVMTYFIAEGLVYTAGRSASELELQFTPFLPFGTRGLLSTIGLVFVSYAGLTKVASVAEEVENPDRNIPLGMILSLGTATLVYVVGVFVMVAVLDPTALREDLTPVVTAGEVFLDWLPQPAGLILIVVAAIAAFASTGNAGILSASRFPLAMARDRLMSPRFARLGRFGTPTFSVVVTSALMLIIIFLLSEEGVAKLASAFKLLIFALTNFAVIVMRESHIATYAPGYRSPLYPWMQIVGMVVCLVLIAEMGNLSLLFTLGVVLAGIGWYFYYARGNVAREGAIYHLFARLGKHRDEKLDVELQSILEEKDLEDASDFDKLIARASVIRLDNPASYKRIVEQAAAQFAEHVPLGTEAIARYFLEGSQHSGISTTHGAALPHALAPDLSQEELVMVQCQSGVCVSYEDDAGIDTSEPVYAFFFLLSPKADQSQHLRTQATLANRTDEESFLVEWRAAANEQEIKETLLHHERYLSFTLRFDTPADDFIDRRVQDVNLPAQSLIALVRRDGEIIIPHGHTELKEGDQLTVIGDPASIDRLHELFKQGEEGQ
jgi:amino acid transporter/mannitol/fructose-specific phosphotransferase system IIA component (Ntr-type)